MTDTALAGALESRLREVYGTPVTISGLRHLTGGASRETWSFTAQVHTSEGTDDSDGSAPKGHRLILRRDPAAADQFPEDVLELQRYLGPTQPGQKIEAVPSRPRLIRTVRGVGYRFAEE